MDDLSRLCIHSITTKPWQLEEALVQYCENGVKGISVWQNAIDNIGPQKAGTLLRSYPIEVVSYVRGGFFPALNFTDRQKAIDHNKALLEEAAAINAPMLVLVCGADPGQSLAVSRQQIQDGIEAIIPLASELGVRLGIEPLHPMFADTRSAINTLTQANDLAESIDSKWVGVVIDAYHVWWDDRLEQEVKRCGVNDNLYGYHINDWKIPTEDMLNDRGLMGEGCIPLKQLQGWVEAAGFTGFVEVEIFSNHYWQMDQSAFLQKIITSYLEYA